MNVRFRKNCSWSVIQNVSTYLQLMLQGIPVKYQKLQRSSCSDFKAVDPLYYTELVSWCMQPLLYSRKVGRQVTTLSFWESPLKIRWKNATWKTSEKKRLGFIATIFTKRKKYQAWRKSPHSENKREKRNYRTFMYVLYFFCATYFIIKITLVLIGSKSEFSIAKEGLFTIFG